MNGHRFGLRRPVPRAGEHTREILAEAEEIETMLSRGVVTAE
jgi:crotonobetainyl-CoA:carnitine CoA-transferase CaiB-like acyl-CoA transferase